MKFVQLILRKIIKTVATRCQILRLKCTKFDFGWGSAPDPAGGTYSVPPDPLAGFQGPTSKGGREGKGEGVRGEGRRRREGRGGLSGNVAEEAFCFKSAPGYVTNKPTGQERENYRALAASGKWKLCQPLDNIFQYNVNIFPQRYCTS